MMPIDIVYLVKNDPENDSEELRYSLRSLSNLPHGNVFIVGEKPDWVQNVTFIPVAQDKTKQENVLANMIAAANDSRVSNDFILMNDDFFIMKKLPHLPNMHFGLMQDSIRAYEKRYPEGSEYINSLKKVNDVLLERGIVAPISYELHTPMMLNRYSVLDMLSTKEQLHQMRSYYGNMYHVGGMKADDVKLFIDPQHNPTVYNDNPVKYMDEQILLSATGGSFKRGIAGEYIRAKFTEKSIYEV